MATAHKTEPYTIMLVEDDDDVRGAVAETLESAGYLVVCAADGAEGIARLQAVESPSMVLLDLIMPRMNGWEFRHEMRKHPRFDDVPVVVMTASPFLDEASAIEASALVTKPLRSEELLRLVAQFVARAA